MQTLPEQVLTLLPLNMGKGIAKRERETALKAVFQQLFVD